MGLPSWCRPGEVVFLNPHSCGMYKNGAVRFKVDANGKRTGDVDNELLDHVESLRKGTMPPGAVQMTETETRTRGILVPNYYDPRWNQEFDVLLKAHGLQGITLEQLEASGVITVSGGHGSPSNDLRVGNVPYIKVSDIRNLRINPNPTNLVPLPLAEKFWGGSQSGLQGWDLITPNRASSNIGEFAVLLPGEEQVVLTKEVFVIRVGQGRKDGWDPFYLMWALCLDAVRRQWRRVVLMQTNREDVGSRYKEIRVPAPKSAQSAAKVSEPFGAHFTALAKARVKFLTDAEASGFKFIPNLKALVTGTSSTGDEGETAEPQ